MVQKIVKCGLIGGFVLFLWGAIAWTVLAWQGFHMKSFSNEIQVQTTIANNIEGSGIYILPSIHQYARGSTEYESAKTRMSQGPFATVAVMAQGKNPCMVCSMISDLIVRIIAASLVTWLLLHSSGPHGIKRSVKFITIIGVVVAIAATLPYVIWFGFPIGFAVVTMVEVTVGWFLAGLAIGKILDKKF